jgi:hypothetical protein
MLARQHQHGGAEQIRRKRTGRDRVDLAGLRVRPVEQAGDEQGGDQDETHHCVERVRRNRVDHRVVDAGKYPQRAERDRGEREPAPQPCARERE